MPKYDFECHACHVPFEVQASFAEYSAWTKEGKIACPACGSNKVIRVFSPPNVHSSSSPRLGGCRPGGSCGCHS